MAISRVIEQEIHNSSDIRKMFEAGIKLKKEYGEDNVFDFSLGNPDIEPPELFFKKLRSLVKNNTSHRYMANSGYPEVRTALAKYLTLEQKVNLSSDNLFMTTGAGGAVNISLKSILNHGDEVIVSSPAFVEYGPYCRNHGGILKIVPCKTDFSLDIEKIEKAVNKKTAAVIINSPNNPSGTIYSNENLNELVECLNRKQKLLNKAIYIISDEPYRKLVYSGVEVPSIMELYNNTIVCSSYSKDLSIPGERIGYAIVHPFAESSKELITAFSYCMRSLGYVNAPSLMQRVVAGLQGEHTDFDRYRKRRDILYNILIEAGFEIELPNATFYLFPKAIGGDDYEVVSLLQKERILAVPGTAFSSSGFFRLTYCVSSKRIKMAREGFLKVGDYLKQKYC